MRGWYRIGSIGVLAVAMMLVLGSRPGMAQLGVGTAQARAHVYLLRGLMNIFSLGMDTLAAKIQRRGIYATVHNHAEWSSARRSDCRRISRWQGRPDHHYWVFARRGCGDGNVGLPGPERCSVLSSLALGPSHSNGHHGSVCFSSFPAYRWNRHRRTNSHIGGAQDRRRGGLRPL